MTSCDHFLIFDQVFNVVHPSVNLPPPWPSLFPSSLVMQYQSLKCTYHPPSLHTSIQGMKDFQAACIAIWQLRELLKGSLYYSCLHISRHETFHFEKKKSHEHDKVADI